MQKGDIIETEVYSLNSEGEGIAKTPDGIVIFIKNAVPGDFLKIKIIHKKKKYYIGSIINILKTSEHRINPVCKHFGICGGCKLQNLNYDFQAEFKSQLVLDSFTRIGNFSNVKIKKIIKANDVFHYRNKMEFSFSDDKWLNISPDKENKSNILQNNKNIIALGLHIPNFHSKVVDIEECYLQSDISYKIVNFIREFFTSKNKSVYTIKTHSGYLRFLIIRQSVYTNDLMINLITSESDENLMEEFKEHLLNNFPEITTIVNSISKKKAQIAIGETTNIIYGKGYINEILNNENKKLKFKISPNSFFQTNVKQTEKLFTKALNLLNTSKDESLLDLYCGTGTISIFIADRVKQVTGVELSAEAIQDAEMNSNLNKISNLSFIQADIKDFLKTSQNLEKDFDKIILDPPRSGLHPEICKILSETNFSKILYISCNPSTQARDIKIICSKGKYRIDELQPVDMFPQTVHVENICLLSATNL